MIKIRGHYGVRRVHRELLNRGYLVNHKRVQRLIHNMGLLGKRPKERYHSYKGNVADNIINRNFNASRPLQKWATDVSQFNFAWGKCYISPILDRFTNEIISYDLSPHPNLKQITDMLTQAYEKFPILEGLIFHSDQGWKYQHAHYINSLKEHSIIQSMSRKGNCYDNSVTETFFGRLKMKSIMGMKMNCIHFHSFLLQ